MSWFGKSAATAATLTPPGIGGGFNQDQMAMFSQAANDSGLAGMGMGMVDQMTGGGVNTEEIELMYHLMARHPNEVDLFLVSNPAFMSGIADLIAVIMRKELYTWFNSAAIAATVDATVAADLGYSTITQENIDTILANMVKGTDAAGMETTPQQRINSSDAEAIALINQHKYGMQMGQMGQQMNQQQAQWQQQQAWQQQQMMQQQQPGLGAAVGGFGASLVRGTLGLPPSPQYNQYQQQPGMYGQSQQGYGQTA